MRASDVDRDAAVELLRGHHAVGRLTLAEFNERMDTAYGAVTLGELARLIHDLPPPEHLEADVEVIRARMAREQARLRAASSETAIAGPGERAGPTWLAPVPARRPEPVHEAAPAYGTGRRALRAAWTTLNAVTALNVVIWFLVAVAGPGVVYFWPVWVYGPAAAALGSIQMVVWRHGRSPS